MISKEEVFKKIYGDTEWLRPSFPYRAVDKDNLIYYFEKEPNMAAEFWIAPERTSWARGGEADLNAFGGDLWEQSLQTYDEYLGRKNSVKDESEYERDRRLWVEQTMSRLVETVPPWSAADYCLYYDQMRESIESYKSKTNES